MLVKIFLNVMIKQGWKTCCFSKVLKNWSLDYSIKICSMGDGITGYVTNFSLGSFKN